MPTIDIFLKIQKKFEIEAETRIEFYKKLFQHMDGSQGYLVTQKNTTEDEEIVVLIENESFIVCVGNTQFSQHKSLDEAIFISFAAHVVFKHPFDGSCKKTAHFFHKIWTTKFGFTAKDKDKSVNEKVTLYNAK